MLVRGYVPISVRYFGCMPRTKVLLVLKLDSAATPVIVPSSIPAASPVSSPAINDACPLHTSCSSCTADGACGWCSYSGTCSRGTCLPLNTSLYSCLLSFEQAVPMARTAIVHLVRGSTTRVRLNLSRKPVARPRRAANASIKRVVFGASPRPVAFLALVLIQLV